MDLVFGGVLYNKVKLEIDTILRGKVALCLCLLIPKGSFSKSVFEQYVGLLNIRAIHMTFKTDKIREILEIMTILVNTK
jgi:ATP-dependent protease HslVU (ClpYQ) ATPase subunit